MGSHGPRGRGGLSGGPLALLLAATQLLAFSDRFLLTLVAQPLKVDLALSDAQLGLLQGTAFAILHAAAMPFAGGLADRGHRRSVLLASVLVWSAATLACGLVGTFAGLLAARSLLGLGQAAIAPVALSLMAHRLPPERLGRGVSWLTSGASLGRSLALLVGGALLAWLTARPDVVLPGAGPLRPWQALFLLACLPNLVLAVGLWRIVEPPPSPIPIPRGRAALAWVARHRAAYGLHTGASAAAVLIGQTLTAWAPAFYVRAHGLTPAEAGVRLGLIVLCAAPLGHLAAGRWLDGARRTRPRGAAARALALGLGLSIPAAALMTLAPGPGLSLAGFAVLVAVVGFTSPPALAGLQFMTPRALRGRVSALFVAAVTCVAFGLGPVLVGLLNDRVFGPQGVGVAMLVVFAGVALVGAALALASRAGPRPVGVSPSLSRGA